MNKQKTIIEKTYKDKSIVETFDYEREKYFYQRDKHKIESNFLINTLNLFNKPIKVLDVACGTGRMLNEVFKSKNNIDYYGLDTSKEMISKLKNKTKEKIHLNIADASKLPYKDNTFDVTYTFHLLWHLPKETQEEIVKDMFRVTKNNGYVIIDYINKDFIFEKFKKLFGLKTAGIYKLSKKELEFIIKSNKYSLEKLLDIPLFNSFLYFPFHLFNLCRKILPSFLFHMCFVRIKKEDSFNV